MESLFPPNLVRHYTYHTNTLSPSCPDPSSLPSRPLFPAIPTPLLRRRPLWWLLCCHRHLCSAVFPSALPSITTLPSSLRSTPPSLPLPDIVASAPPSLPCYLCSATLWHCDLELVNSLSKVIKAAAVLELLQLDLSYYDTLEPHIRCLCDVKSKELGRDCTTLELYLHVHMKKHDGQTFIDAWLVVFDERNHYVQIVGLLHCSYQMLALVADLILSGVEIRPLAEIQRMCEEMSQSAEEAGDDPYVDETDLYYKVVGVDQKGRVYGLGSTGRRYNDLERAHPPLPPPPPRPSHQETLTPPTAVPTLALDANDVYHPRMYEPEDEKQMNLAPLQQE
ncbi:hypothetical protein Sjap_025911 [Stephania japonica]|uniref:Uncharacterized protein n=1 Tax=Stephania japonica TaxID=461633 RepID=A0AAP0HJZ4_9MAGN